MKGSLAIPLAMLAGAMCCGTPAQAQSSQYGTVYQVHVRASDGLVYFYLDGTRTPRPPCASQPYWVVADEITSAGKQQVALLLLAQATGRALMVWGGGTCSRWPDGEDVRELALTN